MLLCSLIGFLKNTSYKNEGLVWEKNMQFSWNLLEKAWSPFSLKFNCHEQQWVAKLVSEISLYWSKYAYKSNDRGDLILRCSSLLFLCVNKSIEKKRTELNKRVHVHPRFSLRHHQGRLRKTPDWNLEAPWPGRVDQGWATCSLQMECTLSWPFSRISLKLNISNGATVTTSGSMGAIYIYTTYL